MNEINKHESSTIKDKYRETINLVDSYHLSSLFQFKKRTK